MELLTINWSDTFAIVVLGFTMVLVILTLLVFLLLVFDKILAITEKKKNAVSQKIVSAKVNTDNMLQAEHVLEQELAAISAAIFLYFDEVHDKESNVIRIKRIERRYSPWSSKIYGVSPLK